EELEACVTLQRGLTPPRELGRLLLDRGHLTEMQLTFLLSMQRRNIKELEDYTRHKSDDLALVDLLREKGRVPRDLLLAGLRRQAEFEREGAMVRLAKLLFERGVADRDGLQEFLDEQGWEMVVCGDCGSLLPAQGARDRQTCDECGSRILEGDAATPSRSDGRDTLRDPPHGGAAGAAGAAGPASAASRPERRRAGPNDPTRSLSWQNDATIADSQPGPRPPRPDGVLVPADTGRPFGKYELLEEISRGGMGIVYRAYQRDLNRVVALKVLHAEQNVSDIDVQRFRREAHSAASLHHPNIVSVIDVGLVEGRHYLTMEYVEGESLSRLLARERPPVQRATEIMKTVCDAIEFAHRRGIIHRDLKPGNILLDKEGAPRVTDFGLAKQIGGDSHLTRSGTALGTPAYMSPEQADGDSAGVDVRSDVYGLGAVFYHLITGQPPFFGDTTVQTIYKVISHQAPPPTAIVPTTPRAVETICLKAMEKDPAKRYATAAAMADDLGRWLRGEPILARPPSLSETAVRHLRKHRGLVAMAIVSLGMLAASEVKRAADARAASARERATLEETGRRAREVRERFEDEKRQIEQQLRELTGRREEEPGVTGAAPSAAGGGAADAAAGGDPASAAACLVRARAALDRRDWAAVPEELARARERAGEDRAARAQVELLTGLFHLARGEYDKAIQACSLCLAADPDQVHALVNRGIAGRCLGGTGMREAEEDLTAALERAPADGSVAGPALLNRALVRMSLGKTLPAIADFTRLLDLPELEPRERVPAFLFRALCHMERGNFEAAIADNTEVLHLDPKNLQALLNRGVCFVQRYQFDKGLADLSTAAAFEPSDPRLLCKLYVFRALCQYGLGNYPLAVSDNARVLAIDPNSVQALTNRGLALLASGETDKALVDLEKAVNLSPDDRYATPALTEARRMKSSDHP
ncbi:MAG: protein kinase, partial [Planctomycetes bacterium]|nr:protein kinase [Planctomycetota bacterium]